MSRCHLSPFPTFWIYCLVMMSESDLGGLFIHGLLSFFLPPLGDLSWGRMKARLASSFVVFWSEVAAPPGGWRSGRPFPGEWELSTLLHGLQQERKMLFDMFEFYMQKEDQDRSFLSIWSGHWQTERWEVLVHSWSSPQLQLYGYQERLCSHSLLQQSCMLQWMKCPFLPLYIARSFPLSI